MGISSKAMSMMNSFVNDIFERIATESSPLAHYNKCLTITSLEIQTVVKDPQLKRRQTPFATLLPIPVPVILVLFLGGGGSVIVVFIP